MDVRPAAPPTIARELARGPLLLAALGKARTLLQRLLADHAQGMGTHRCVADGEVFAPGEAVSGRGLRGVSCGFGGGEEEEEGEEEWGE